MEEAGVLRIGNVAIDVRISERHEISMQLTRYAVESGKSISDHVVENPNQVEIEFEMTNTPTGKDGMQAGDRARRAFSEFIMMMRERKPVQIITEHATYNNMVFVGFPAEHSAPNLGTLRASARFQQAGILGARNAVTAGRNPRTLAGYAVDRDSVGAALQRMDMRTGEECTYRTGCERLDSGLQSFTKNAAKINKVLRTLTLYGQGIF